MTKCLADMKKRFSFPRLLEANCLGEEGRKERQRTG